MSSKQKIAIITGNAKGLGKAISEALTGIGFQTPDVIRRSDYDLTKPEAAEKLVKDTITKYGRLDLLVNNVGDFIHKNISDVNITEWHEMMNSNLNSAFYMCHYALPYLRSGYSTASGAKSLSPHVRAVSLSEQSVSDIDEHNNTGGTVKNYKHILNIGYAGMEHFRTYPNTTAYQASKAGLLVLSKGLAKAEAANNVLVNMLSPGHMENTIAPYTLENISVGRLATLKEASEAALFLISQNYITGQNLEIAGGWGL